MGRPRKPIPEEEPAVAITHSTDGRYHAFVNVGYKPNGDADRRHVSSKDEKVVKKGVQELQKKIRSDGVPKPGKMPTLAEFLRDWLDDPDDKYEHEWDYNTKERTYRWAIELWIIPGLGGWHLDKLGGDVLGTFFKGIRRDPDSEDDAPGLEDGGAHNVFRVLRSALNDAVTHKLIMRNPIEFMIKKPKYAEPEITPLYVDEVRRIVEVCRLRPNGTRWSIGMPLGLRQGEALGLPWWIPAKTTRDKPHGLDAGGGWLTIRQQTERRSWRHGCDDPVACALTRCRLEPCKTRWTHGCGKPPEQCTKQRVDRCPKRTALAHCADHRSAAGCAKVCKKGCTGHAQFCPQQAGGGIHFVETKSRAGNRKMALPAQMQEDAKRHETLQEAERRAAGDAWHDFGLVWCQPNGKPLDAHQDWLDWKEVLNEAGVRDARVHDGRHTAATMLLMQGVDPAVVMAIMGWSQASMLKRYQHVVDELRVEAAHRLGALIHGEPVNPADDSEAWKKVKELEAKIDDLNAELLKSKIENAEVSTELRILKRLNIDFGGYATSPATTAKIADVIPIRR